MNQKITTNSGVDFNEALTSMPLNKKGCPNRQPLIVIT
jgi:hypothetical protein